MVICECSKGHSVPHQIDRSKNVVCRTILGNNKIDLSSLCECFKVTCRLSYWIVNCNFHRGSCSHCHIPFSIKWESRCGWCCRVYSINCVCIWALSEVEGIWWSECVATVWWLCHWDSREIKGRSCSSQSIWVRCSKSSNCQWWDLTGHIEDKCLVSDWIRDTNRRGVSDLDFSHSNCCGCQRSNERNFFSIWINFEPIDWCSSSLYT